MGVEGSRRRYRCMSPAARSPRSFYKIILPAIIHDHKMRIPVEFAKLYEKELSSFASLIVPNGRVFRVQVEKADKMLWFHNGWTQFAEHHSIRCGFLLVFDYEGNSIFKVQMFDLTATEIQYPKNSLAICEEPKNENKSQVVRKRGKRCGFPVRSHSFMSSASLPLHEKEKDVRVFKECLLWGVEHKRCFHALLPKLSDFAPEFAMRIDKFGKCIPVSSLDFLRSNIQFLMRNKRQKVENMGQTSKFEIVTIHKGTVKVNGTSSGCTELENDELNREYHENFVGNFSVTEHENNPEQFNEDSKYGQLTTQMNKDGDLVKVKCKEEVEFHGMIDYGTSPMGSTLQKNKKAVNLALSLKLGNPHFMSTMKKYHVMRGFILNVSPNFADKYFPRGLKFLKLEGLDGKHWEVACLLWKGRVRFLSRGWIAFVRHNNLVEGDVCLFELVEVDDVVLKVHIFRANQ